MIRTIRKTLYVTPDGTTWDDREKAFKHDLVCKLRDVISAGLQSHLDAEEIAHVLLSKDSPVIIVSKPDAEGGR